MAVTVLKKICSRRPKSNSWCNIQNRETNYELRGNAVFVQKLVRSTLKTFSMSFTGVKKWNSLDNEIRNIETLSAFKKTWKEITLNSYSKHWKGCI